MAKILTAKDILLSQNFLKEQEKSRRYVHHEFQDYAYRLASDLGDLQHKAIYMRLAKTVPRTLLEQAAAFALGYFHEKNKGKIFMWKLQEIREDFAIRQKLSNFDSEFVISEMAKLRDDLLLQIKKRSDARFTLRQRSILPQVLGLISERNSSKTKLLQLGCEFGQDLSLLSNSGAKLYGWDFSRKLVSVAKQKVPNAKFTSKPSFIKSKFKNNYYDVVWIDELWKYVPLGSEMDYLKLVVPMIKHGGKLLITIQLEDKPVQCWEEFEIEKKRRLFFNKRSLLGDLLENAYSLGCQLHEHICWPSDWVSISDGKLKNSEEYLIFALI